jgi:phenylalanyl-tRNA synthetase beta chain
MKITLSWLKDYFETNASLDEIVVKLTNLGLEVDSVENPAEVLKPVLIAEVLEANPHPDADRLKICRVNTGKEILQVVCGAPNVRAGLKVAFAPEGTYIPGSGITLKRTKIRGVESCGMMCSGSELNMEDTTPGGIIELPMDAPVGDSFVEYMHLDDPVIDIEFTPNRGDCLSAYGIARDLSASGLGQMKPVAVPQIKGAIQSPIAVTIAAECVESKACEYFVGRYIRGVKNGPSPQWMQQRLKAVGLRPISALVDITNYVAHAIGRPMHAFDADKLTGDLCVRFAKEGETLTALDDKDYTFDSEITLVVDEKRPQAVGGIIGGKESSCTEETTNVFLESAYFNAVRTSLTGRKLGIITDARYRFERGVDPAWVRSAVEMATGFITEYCGGEVSEVLEAGKPPIIDHTIVLNPARINLMTGLQITLDENDEILKRLGFVVERQTDNLWHVRVPSWRHDVSIEEDLIEEVARIVGYDNIPTLLMPPLQHLNEYESKPGQSLRQAWSWKVRRSLAGRGLNEALTWAFVAESHAELFGGGSPSLRLANPISSELTDMRPSLLPNLISAVSKNVDRGLDDHRLFEVGSQFTDVTLDGQSTAVAGVRGGDFSDRHWDVARRPVDVFDAKADLLACVSASGFDTDSMQINAEAPSWYHPGRSGTVSMGSNVIGYFGEIHPNVLKKMDVTLPIVGFEFFMDNLPATKGKKSRPFYASTLQPVERDLAFIVREDITAQMVIKAAKNADKKMIQDVNVFDVYAGKGVEDGHKSLAISITLQPYEKTLTDADIEGIMKTVIDGVGKATEGRLRT